MSDSPGVEVWLGLGANLGDASATLRTALARIATWPGTELCQVSSFYRSAPLDAGGPDFINAVARLRTTLGPHEVLQAAQQLEADAGRERPYRNAPRTLDVDVLLHGQARSSDPLLTLPHPRLHQRAFVLLPMAELAPELVIAGLGPVTVLLAAVQGQRIERLSPG